MEIEARAGFLETHDIEEQNEAASPWQVIHRQLSPGRFLGTTSFAQIHGMLFYRQQWSQCGFVTGATPAGFLVLGGSATQKTRPRWCGEELDSQCLAFGFDATETEFVVPDGSDHWVLLTPIDLITDYLGAESTAALLRKRQVLRCESRLRDQLFTLVDRTVRNLRADSKLLADDRVLNAIQSQVLGAVEEVLVAADADADHSTPRKRYLAFRRAIRFADAAAVPISVPDLAAAAGVSPRVLGLSFQENFGISPRKYLRWIRLNHLHRALRDARMGSSTVTEIAHRWGFQELGRTAVEHKWLFGESPSSTLARVTRPHLTRLSDALL